MDSTAHTRGSSISGYAAQKAAVDRPRGESAPDEWAQQMVQACFVGNLRTVQSLLGEGVSAQASAPCGPLLQEMTALQAAILGVEHSEASPKMARLQSARIVRVLMSAGATLDKQEKSLIMLCADCRYYEILEAIGSSGLRIRRYGFEMMIGAIVGNDLDIIALLNRHDCSINILNDRHSRPLLEIAAGNFLNETQRQVFGRLGVGELASMLRGYVQRGLNLEAVDKIGATALMRSIVSGNLKLMHALLACGANVHARLNNDVSCLHLAAKHLPTDDFKELLLNVRDAQDVRRMRLKVMIKGNRLALKAI